MSSYGIAQDPIILTHRMPRPLYDERGRLINSDEYDEFDEFWWLKTVRYDISLGGKDIGSLAFWVIELEEIRDRFYGEMDGPSQECMEFGFTLFDEHGNFKASKFRNEGTGAWGKEVDDDYIVYLQDIYIEEAYRGRGIATKVLENMWKLPEIAYAFNLDFVFAWPTPRTTVKLTKAEWVEQRERLIKLFRSVGFRRIGNTVHFCLAKDPHHFSKQVPIDQDAPHLEPSTYAEAQAADKESSEAFMAMLKQWGVPGYT
ncbi:hypothetical protein BCR35DRAFT_304700 [Leucosporidium creatinivorum]|uniref:N-acetyltransferase domain-containing protein n=1 Tax=Leucosporidium creatinivorum TaxID=106004 RepID=A0A1Y2F5Y2_9BASI|nr:hypothetical protein BCR35DRAFT_304700 [Leucosporidium creatinivorum]